MRSPKFLIKDFVMDKKYGIWSAVSKKFCFGISQPTKKLARSALYKKIGYDALKYRFSVKEIK